MKTLPSIEVTDAQYARLAAVIPGADAAEKAASYISLVKTMLRNMVIDAEIRLAGEQAELDRQQAVQAAYNNPDNV